MVSMWALIVGISTYQSSEHPDIGGPHKDVDGTTQYLRDELHVPFENIVVLENEEATRQRIIDAFRDHLIKNSRIQNGDPILFHFSGHGGRSQAPDGWSVVGTADGGPSMLEMIIPYDEGIPDNRGNPICGIPDRTLSALLCAATREHGENVTVVLDCCSSGHGTRSEGSPYSVRGIDPKKVTPLRPDVDRDIWGSLAEGDDTIREQSRGGFTIQRAKSHVLVAACRQEETAMGSDEVGGIFTSLWLKALRDESIKPRSYSQLMKVVSREVDGFRKLWPEDVNQHPQCEGITRDRLVFQNTGMDPHLFEVENASGNMCRILAGEVQGVQVGTTFELYEITPPSATGSRTLGTAVARDVNSTCCFAEVDSSIRLLTGNIHSARISGQVNPLRYTITNTEPSSPDALSTVEKIEQDLSAMSPEIACVIQRVSDPDEADLILEVDGRNGGGVTLQRRDAILRNLNSPRMDTRDICDADFANLLNSIARFNAYLSRSNDTHPFSEFVELEFHLLKEGPYPDLSSDGDSTKLRGLDREVLPKDDELVIQQVDTDDYVFILRNSGLDPLYVYLVYFDTGTYEISIWYSPANPDQPTLLSKGGILQIGESAEHADPFSFFVRKGDNVDTSFIKVFITDSPTQVLFMEQRPQIGRDENERRYLRFKRANDTPPGVDVRPQKGSWDCLTRKIIVHR